MQIHIMTPDEGLKETCNRYGIAEENVRYVNQIESDEPAIGQEMLMLMPTRTYRVQFGDTPERISLRFGITKRDLFTLNPWICTRELTPGETLTLRYDERKHGMKVANGYFFSECPDSALTRALPYLTYVTFASASANERGVRRIFNDSRQVKLVSDESKIPLVRVYDSYADRFKKGGDTTPFAERLIEIAKDGNYKGIVLNSSAFSDSAKEYMAFMVRLRKMMIGCDLILITEIDEKSPIEFSEYADGSVMYYPKFALDNPPSFDEGEKAILTNFACDGESAKTFVDLSCAARGPRGFCPIGDALKLARQKGYPILQNENTLLSRFVDKRQGEYVFQSLKGLERIFELIHQLDYMGICFDIMRVPTQLLMMYNALFKTCYHTNVRSREGCSRVAEE